jgi:hypothetical protein
LKADLSMIEKTTEKAFPVPEYCVKNSEKDMVTFLIAK